MVVVTRVCIAYERGRKQSFDFILAFIRLKLDLALLITFNTN